MRSRSLHVPGIAHAVQTCGVVVAYEVVVVALSLLVEGRGVHLEHADATALHVDDGLLLVLRGAELYETVLNEQVVECVRLVVVVDELTLHTGDGEVAQDDGIHDVVVAGTVVCLHRGVPHWALRSGR